VGAAGPVPDVAVIGAGIVGCALAAFLAERGAGVRLYERGEVAAAASGRNSGSLQHPLAEALAGLHEETVRHYRELEGFPLPTQPSGVLVLAEDEAAIEASLGGLERRFPELAPRRLAGAALVAVEPGLAPDLAGCRLETGYPVPPASATRAFAGRARRAGASVEEGRCARIWRLAGRAAGVEVDGERVPAGAVVVAAGPWTPALADPTGSWRPVAPVWGVNVELRLADPPRHVLEEAGMEALLAGGTLPPADFSLVTAEGISSLGSAFRPDEPDPWAHVAALHARGARFVPALGAARVRSARGCPRPQSSDGRPLLGALPGLERLFVASGHGPWGISLGPASARIVADELLDGVPAPPALAAARFGAVGDGGRP
jgi:glycine/D-amino acid oxidase-like deaminating enzyme